MDMFAAYILWQDRRNLPVSIGFIARITSTSSLQPPWNITLCVLNHYISLSYIIPHETSLFFDDYPHCHTLYNYFHNVPTICVLVKRWLASGLRLPRSEVGRWPLSNWAMQFSHVPLLILEYVTPLLSVCPCHYRVTCVLTLIGLRVVAIGSSEVLLSGLVDTSHLSVKYQSVPWHGTEVRSRPHAITDGYLLKMTLGTME
jgi:hypothetical protein